LWDNGLVSVSRWNRKEATLAILFDPDADAVGEEESHLGDFLDGPDAVPPRAFTPFTTSAE
jgi:phosphomannomutase